MPKYIYTAEVQGQQVRGVVKAQSKDLARLQLKAKGVTPDYITEKPAIAFFSGGGEAASKDILIFTRQMAFLLSSGVSLLRALSIAHSMTDNAMFKKHVGGLLSDVEAGKSFSAALRARPNVFPGLYVNMVVCAEETGLLDQILSDLALYLEKAESLKSKVKSAMMYPVIVLSISFVIIGGIIMFIVPKFEALYSGAAAGLPGLTQLLVNMSNGMREHWLLMLFALVGSFLLLSQYMKTETGRRNISSAIAALPLFAQLQFEGALARFSRAMFSLLKSGVNLLEALDIAGNIASHESLQKALKLARLHITQGQGFAYGLSKSHVFPSLVINMTRVGEESGQIEKTFEKLTSYYEEELENTIAGLVKLIEPIMIVLLGSLIGGIILALYLPVFKMGDIV